jgi:hypothetical protein
MKNLEHALLGAMTLGHLTVRNIGKGKEIKNYIMRQTWPPQCCRKQTVPLWRDRLETCSAVLAAFFKTRLHKLPLTSLTIFYNLKASKSAVNRL